MGIIGRVHHIRDYTPVDLKTTDSNTINDIGKTYYPVKFFFQHHETTERLFRGNSGLMMVGNVMESPTGISEPSIRDIELYLPYKGDQRFEYDQSQTIMMVELMVKGSLIFNNWIKEHGFYELMFLVHDLEKDRKVVISPDELPTTKVEFGEYFNSGVDRNNDVRAIAFGLRRIYDEAIINSIK